MTLPIRGAYGITDSRWESCNCPSRYRRLKYASRWLDSLMRYTLPSSSGLGYIRGSPLYSGERLCTSACSVGGSGFRWPLIRRSTTWTQLIATLLSVQGSIFGLFKPFVCHSAGWEVTTHNPTTTVRPAGALHNVGACLRLRLWSVCNTLPALRRIPKGIFRLRAYPCVRACKRASAYASAYVYARGL